MNPEKPIYVVDVVKAAVDKVRTALLGQLQTADPVIQTVHYQYGHRRELLETLLQMRGNAAYDKYPLIYLVTDFRERRGQEAGIYADVTLNIIIAHQTTATYRAAERMQNVFKPVLYQLYYALLEELAAISHTYSEDMLPHDKWDRYYWGRSNISAGVEHQENALQDFVDAIEIVNLNLKLDYKNC